MEIRDDVNFNDLVTFSIYELQRKGRWLESGTIQVHNELWTYKFQKLKQKPRKRQNDDTGKQKLTEVKS